MATLEPQKIPVYSLNDLKNTTDDALAPYLTKLSKPYTLKQSHYYTNVRLAVGYTAVLIGAATFYADWKLGWDKTKDATLVACVVYFVLNGFLTYWIWLAESGKVFVGYREGGQKLTLSSSVQKHKPVYKLKVVYEAPSGQKWMDQEIEAPFHRWFSSDGFLQKAHLQHWLANTIEMVGMADPKSKQGPDEKVGAVEGDSVVMSGALSEASEVSGPESPKRSGRKPKRKA
ncbi:MAG: hypothetical protein Q9227_004259 [Pyrenula ochraceoflavens]